MNLVRVNDDAEELKSHGDLEYPVGCYQVRHDHLYIGFIRWHWHDELEFSYVKKGKVKFCINEETYILSKGQCIFINHNILHSIHPVDNDDFDCYCTVFHSAYLFGHGNTRMTTTYLSPISSNPDIRYIIFDGSEDYHLQISSSLEEIYNINQKKEYGYELVTRNLLTTIWLILLDKLSNGSVTISTERFNQLTLDESRTKAAITFIQRNYSDAISLDDIAASIHISKGECCRCFKRSINVTPFEYLLKYRIFMAASMILENREAQTISDLAISVGFNSSSYFNKLFKKYLNCTPTEFKSLPQKRIDFPNIVPMQE